MKKMTKLLASILVIAMAASILCVPAFADGENPLAKYGEGTGYVALGDSFTRGYGASANFENEIYTMDDLNNPNCRNVTGSYPLLVAQALGLRTPDDIRDDSANYWCIAQDCLTSAFFNDFLGLEDNYSDTEFIFSSNRLKSRYETNLYYFGTPESFGWGGVGTYGKDGTVMNVHKMIEDASLISVALGMGDVLYRTQELYFNTMDLSNTETLPDQITTLIEELYLAYDVWQDTYRVLLDYVKEANSDATVVLIGAINPILNIQISDDYLIPIGSAINFIVDAMNAYYKQCAEEYGFIFIDISNIETPITERDLSLSGLFNLSSDDKTLYTHPSPEGYAQIARLIVEALKEKEAAEKEAKTTIKVDLGRFKSVDYVLVNGKSVSNYELNDSVLKVKVGNPFATSLTVATHDGLKVAISVYSLSYDNGYSAYRLYTTNDVLNAAATTAKSAATAIKGALGKLFSK